MLEKIANLALAIILILVGFGAWGVAIARVLTHFFAFLFSLYLLDKKVFPVLRSTVRGITSTRAYFSYSRPLFFSTSISSFSDYVDTIMLGFLIPGTYLVGIYNAMLPVAIFLLIFSTAFTRIFLPLVSTLFGEGRLGEISMLYNATLRWVFLGTWPLFLVFF